VSIRLRAGAGVRAIFMPQGGPQAHDRLAGYCSRYSWLGVSPRFGARFSGETARGTHRRAGRRQIGDEVFGLTGGVGGLQGSLAEFAAVDPDLMAKKLANLSMREAAALPLVLLTAWEGLVDRADVRAGQKVLVLGALGVWVISLYRSPSRAAPECPPRPQTQSTTWSDSLGV
jgi:hypothetical protein